MSSLFRFRRSSSQSPHNSARSMNQNVRLNLQNSSRPRNYVGNNEKERQLLHLAKLYKMNRNKYEQELYGMIRRGMNVRNIHRQMQAVQIKKNARDRQIAAYNAKKARNNRYQQVYNTRKSIELSKINKNGTAGMAPVGTFFVRSGAGLRRKMTSATDTMSRGLRGAYNLSRRSVKGTMRNWGQKWNPRGSTTNKLQEFAKWQRMVNNNRRVGRSQTMPIRRTTSSVY